MKHHKHKKFYTKSDYADYVYIYSKLGVITGTFATAAMSLALFLGFVVTLIGHNHLDMSSLFSLVLFILSLPVVIRNVKRYKEIQDRLQGKFFRCIFTSCICCNVGIHTSGTGC